MTTAVTFLDAALPPERDTLFCRGCKGTTPRVDTGIPIGWYALTVSVPRDINRKGYIWVGMFCSAACLGAWQPEIAEAEALARQAYDAAPVTPRIA